MSKKNTEPQEPAKVVVALTSFAKTLPNGWTIAVNRGEKLRGDAAVVIAAPEMFAPDGLADAEYAELRLALRTHRADANARAHQRVLDREAQKAGKPKALRPHWPDALSWPAVFGGGKDAA